MTTAHTEILAGRPLVPVGVQPQQVMKLFFPVKTCPRSEMRGKCWQWPGQSRDPLGLNDCTVSLPRQVAANDGCGAETLGHCPTHRDRVYQHMLLHVVPHFRVRPFHRKSTCLTQLPKRPCVVQICPQPSKFGGNEFLVIHREDTASTRIVGTSPGTHCLCKAIGNCVGRIGGAQNAGNDGCGAGTFGHCCCDLLGHHQGRLRSGNSFALPHS